MDASSLLTPFKRDHLIFIGAMTFVAAGLADGLHRGFGLPWWGAVPIGLALWTSFVSLMYRQSQKERAMADGS